MSLKSPELSLIIPCYNEELNIPPLMKRLNLIQEEWIEFILVNNGSNDNTRNIIVKEAEKLDLKIKLVDIKKNNGYGYGIMEGIKTGSGSILSWTHADLQTDPKDVINAYYHFKEIALDKNYILKGKRYGRKIFDTIFTLGMSFLSSVIMGEKLSDINAQPKLFYKEFLSELVNCPDDFSLDLYFLYMGKTKGYNIIEFPVEFSDRVYEESKGGGSLRGKWSLIRRTWIYMIALRKKVIK